MDALASTTAAKWAEQSSMTMEDLAKAFPEIKPLPEWYRLLSEARGIQVHGSTLVERDAYILKVDQMQGFLPANVYPDVDVLVVCHEDEVAGHIEALAEAFPDRVHAFGDPDEPGVIVSPAS